MNKNLAKTVKTLLIMLNNLQQMRLKMLQKEQFKKEQKQLVIRLAIKLLTKLRKFQNVSELVMIRNT